MRYFIKNTYFIDEAQWEISSDEFDRLFTCKSIFAQVVSAEEKFDTFIENYAELEGEIRNTAIRVMCFQPQDSIGIIIARNQIARRVSNLLSSTRLYVETIISHTRSINAAEYDNIRNLTNNLYDETLAYRVVHELRNYTQHYNLPVHRITLESSSMDFSEGGDYRHDHSVTIEISNELLEENKKFKKRVLSELDDIDDHHSLMPFIRVYVDSLVRIHDFFRKATDTQRNSAIDYAKRYAEHYARQNAGHTSADYARVMVVKQTDANLIDDSFNLSFATNTTYCDYLRRKNGSTSNFAGSTVQSRKGV